MSDLNQTNAMQPPFMGLRQRFGAAMSSEYAVTRHRLVQDLHARVQAHAPQFQHCAMLDCVKDVFVKPIADFSVFNAEFARTRTFDKETVSIPVLSIFDGSIVLSIVKEWPEFEAIVALDSLRRWSAEAAVLVGMIGPAAADVMPALAERIRQADDGNNGLQRLLGLAQDADRRYAVALDDFNKALDAVRAAQVDLP